MAWKHWSPEVFGALLQCDELCSRELWEGRGGLLGLGVLVPISNGQQGSPTPDCSFLAPQRFPCCGRPPCRANSMDPSCHLLPFKIMCFILARSLLPLVLHLSAKKGLPEPVFEMPGFFSPLTTFLDSLSFWCTLVFYPSSKWKRVDSVTKKGVTLGWDTVCPERTVGFL